MLLERGWFSPGRQDVVKTDSVTVAGVASVAVGVDGAPARRAVGFNTAQTGARPIAGVGIVALGIGRVATGGEFGFGRVSDGAVWITDIHRAGVIVTE